jgi:hypothetical protein
MPPELVDWLKDSPYALLVVFLASPFLVFIGVVISAIVQRLRDKDARGVSEAGVSVSETEAETHQFQAIIEGFSKTLEAVSKRAESAESKAASAEAKADAADEKANEAETKANELSRRVRSLEDERNSSVSHIIMLESLIPYPPGPPERPYWMRHLESGVIRSIDNKWVPENDNQT